MFMPGVWILWSKKKNVIIFQKENGNTFTLFIIFIVKSLQKEQNSTNLLLWPPICRNKPVITPKWFNSLDTNYNFSSWNAFSLLTLFFYNFFKVCQNNIRNKIPCCILHPEMFSAYWYSFYIFPTAGHNTFCKVYVF